MLKHRGTAIEYEGIRKQNQETVCEKSQLACFPRQGGRGPSKCLVKSLNWVGPRSHLPPRNTGNGNAFLFPHTPYY